MASLSLRRRGSRRGPQPITGPPSAAITWRGPRRLALRPRGEQLRRISPRQIDRRLAPQPPAPQAVRPHQARPLLKHPIPLKTDRRDVAVPGFTEIDLVAHCGSYGDGEFGTRSM